MEGIVEIYRNFGTEKQELLCKESNVIVDGAGETICDLWTTPSGSVSCIPNLVDSSNYTVQAISFGKGSNAYKRNAHFFPLHTSSYAAHTVDNELPYFSYVNLVKTDNIIRAVSEKNENISHSVCSYDPQCDVGSIPNQTDRVLEPNTLTALDETDDQFHLMGTRYMQGRDHAFGHNLNRLISNTNPNLLSFTEDPDNAVWKQSNVSGLVIKDETTGPFWGTSAIQFSGAVGNPTLRQDVSANQTYATQKRYFDENLDHTFSVYVRLSETPTRQPQTVVLNMKVDDLTSTGQDHEVTFTTSGGTIQNPAYLTYSDADTQNASGGVEILGIGATDFQVGWQRIHCRVEGLGAATKGDYIRPILFMTTTGSIDVELQMHGWQLEESFGSTEYKAVSGLQPSFDEGGLDGDIFLGCYPNVSGTKFAIVSSLPNLDLNDPTLGVFASGIYPNTSEEHFFNLSSLRSMDQNGFVQSFNSILGETTDSTSGLIVSANSDFSSTGEVSYICTISSGDLGTANMYGGIFKCGLWTVDKDKTLNGSYGHGGEGSIQTIKYPKLPPFKFKAGFNRLVYKLFAEKSFTLNLARILDNGSDAGCIGYDPLTIVWRIKFR